MLKYPMGTLEPFLSLGASLRSLEGKFMYGCMTPVQNSERGLCFMAMAFFRTMVLAFLWHWFS